MGIAFENIGIAVRDLEATMAFFTDLGLTEVGRDEISGTWADTAVGLDGNHAKIAMLETPDGHGHIELFEYVHPDAIETEPTLPNEIGMHRVAFQVDDLHESLATGREARIGPAPSLQSGAGRVRGSGLVVQRDLVAVGVGERERAAERAVDRRRDDGVSVGGEGVVDLLDPGGVQPDRGADAGLRGAGDVRTRDDVAERERDRRRLEDDGVRRAGLRADQAEVLLVERLGCGEVGRLEVDEVGAGDGHVVLLHGVSVF
jgi:glyoxylase I family protein